MFRADGTDSPLLPLNCSWSATSHWMNRVFCGSNFSSRAALHFTPASRFQSTSATYKEQRNRGSAQLVKQTAGRTVNTHRDAAPSWTSNSAIKIRGLSPPPSRSAPDRQPQQLLKVAKVGNLGRSNPPHSRPELAGSPLTGGRVSRWEHTFPGGGGRAPTLTLAPLCRSASAKALPMPCAAPVTSATLPFTCMTRPLLRAVGELGVSAPPQLLWPPARARAARRGALLRVGGDETVKPAQGSPRLCHLALSAPGRQASRSLPS